MNNISVILHNNKAQVAKITVTLNDDKPTVIEAVEKVNYEFFDESAGFAPHHIITKRVDNNLHVSFEEEGIDSDLIINDFFDDENQALVGIAEDGNYYYYIPDTGEVVDYVTQLEVGDIEGQALGGEHMAIPLWITLTPVGLPWWSLALGGLLLAGGAIAAVNDDDDSAPTPQKPTAKNQTLSTTEDIPIDIPLIGSDADGTVVSYTITSTPPITQGTLSYDDDNNSATPAVAITAGVELTPAQAQTVQFMPAKDFNGEVDSILFTTKDNDNLVSDEATIAVTIIAVNDSPTAEDDINYATETGEVEIGKDAIGNVISNDSDPDGDTLQVTSIRLGNDEGEGDEFGPNTVIQGKYGKVSMVK